MLDFTDRGSCVTSNARSTTLTPAAFRAAHPDVTTWSAIDFDVPVFAPIEFHTAVTGVLATEVPVADWSPVDFDVYETYASTARHIPSPVIDAALHNIEAAFALWEAEEQARVEAELETAWAEQVEYELAAGGFR